MLTTERAQKYIRLMIPVFIAVFSICVLSNVMPKTKMIDKTVESLEDSKTTVMEFAGATIGASLAISALPDDFATPLANTLSDLNEYLVFVLIAIFLEKLIAVEGMTMAFRWIIPAACVLYFLFEITHKQVLKRFAIKIATLGIAIAVVVPISTAVTNYVGKEALTYVDETISETASGTDKINDAMTSGDTDKTVFEKLSDAFKTAIKGMTDLLDYIKNSIKKCINSIAILIVTNVVIPLLTILFLIWLVKELFKIPDSTVVIQKGKATESVIGEKSHEE